MTIYQFLAMDEMEQAEAVWEAVLIGDREDEEHKILLYQIDDFMLSTRLRANNILACVHLKIQIC